MQLLKEKKMLFDALKKDEDQNLIKEGKIVKHSVLALESHNILYVLKEICRRKTTDSYKALRIRAFEVLDQYSDIHNLTITQLSDYCYIKAIDLILNAWDLPENGDFGPTNMIQGLIMDWKNLAVQPASRKEKHLVCPRWWTANYMLGYFLSNKKCNYSLKSNKISKLYT